MSKRFSFAWVALAIIALVAADQLTKAYVNAHLVLGDEHPVIPGLLNFTFVRNQGAAWGILQGWHLALAFLAIAMLVVLAVFRKRIFGSGRLATMVFVLLFAGIAGNFIDRVFLGYVVDFIDFFHGAWHFPAFNIADSCICVGVFLYMFRAFFPQPGTTSEAGAAEQPSSQTREKTK